jgi:hypothetical protein
MVDALKIIGVIVIGIMIVIPVTGFAVGLACILGDKVADWVGYNLP